MGDAIFLALFLSKTDDTDKVKSKEGDFRPQIRETEERRTADCRIYRTRYVISGRKKH